MLQHSSRLSACCCTAGLIHLRRGGLTTTDQILAAEKAGAWSEALALYEQALGHESYEQTSSARVDGPGAAAAAALAAAHGAGAGAVGDGSGGLGSKGGLTALQEGHLRCLLPMGHLQSLLRQVGAAGAHALCACRQAVFCCLHILPQRLAVWPCIGLCLYWQQRQQQQHQQWHAVAATASA